MAENQMAQHSWLLILADIASLWKRSPDQETNHKETVYKVAVDNLESGIILLDAQNNVLDLNIRAKQIIKAISPNTGPFLVNGKSARNALDMWPNLVAYIYSSNKQYHTLLTCNIGDEVRYYDVQVEPVYSESTSNNKTRNNKNEGDLLIGRYIVLHDSSDRERATNALQERKKQLRSMVEQLRKADRYQAALADSVQQELAEPIERLNAIIHSLEQQPIPDQLQQQINRLKAEASTIHKIVEEMDVFSHHRRPPSFYAEASIKNAPVLPEADSLRTESFH